MALKAGEEEDGNGNYGDRGRGGIFIIILF